jgi:hypothetical protein
VEDHDVRHHVSQCAVCAEVARVGEALAADQKAVRMFLVDSPLPSAGQVWRRAALRAQADAVHAASRPLVWAQGLAGAVVVGLAVAALGAMWPALAEAFGRVASALVPPSHVADGVLRMLGDVVPRRWAAVVVGVAACVALSPAVVYWALRDVRRP